MAIDISNTFITLAGGCFFQAADGIEFSGQISAHQFCDTRKFQGESFGYVSGGADSTIISTNNILKYPFTSDSTSTTVGSLALAVFANHGGQSSETDGYSSGGEGGSPPVATDRIQKFPFSSDTNATDIAELALTTICSSGQSSKLNSVGFLTGRHPSSDTIQCFPFAVDAPATDIAEMTSGRKGGGGHSSLTDGYISGGCTPTGVNNTIEKFSFASVSTSSCIGTLDAVSQHSSHSSDTSGYTFNGRYSPSSPLPSVTTNKINKFPFATDGNATDIDELSSVCTLDGIGTSSTTFGYAAGGGEPNGALDRLDKFPFSSDTSASDVAELSEAVTAGSGQQV